MAITSSVMVFMALNSAASPGRRATHTRSLEHYSRSCCNRACSAHPRRSGVGRDVGRSPP